MKLVGSILKVVKNFKTEMEAIQFLIKQRMGRDSGKVQCDFSCNKRVFFHKIMGNLKEYFVVQM